MSQDKIIGLRVDKTIYKVEDKVVKVFHNNYHKSQVLNEALNQARIEETNLLVPKLIKVEFKDNQGRIEQEYIKGNTLANLFDKHPENKEQYLDLFVDLQIKVQNTVVDFMSKLKDKLNYKIEQSDLLATTRYHLRRKLETMPKHNKLCHGDFSFSNVIITDDNEIYVIDWAHASIGNASADACISYLDFLMNYNQEMAEEYLKLFCEKTKTNSSYVKSWLPIIAAARSTKGIRSERDFLLDLTNREII